MNKNLTASEIEALIISERNERQREILMRFFKTGKGEYGEGDEFLGLKVPQTRAIVKEAKGLVELSEIKKLLYSKWHEVRLCGFLLLVEEMKANLPKKTSSKKMRKQEIAAFKDEYRKEKDLDKEVRLNSEEEIKSKRRKEIAEFYLRHARQANNWDLVDLSCSYILGPFIRFSEQKNFDLLYKLADSDNLWEQRISIVTTIDFIRNGLFTPTLTLADKLISHPHDLMHKAIGWMLREIGKKDKEVLSDYLEKRYARLPRTSLRYAIERFNEADRQYWLKRR